MDSARSVDVVQINGGRSMKLVVEMEQGVAMLTGQRSRTRLCLL
jgi:hypothetical protein